MEPFSWSNNSVCIGSSRRLIHKLKISTADVEETWTIDDAVKKLRGTPQKRNEWQVAFKEGVELEDKVVYDTFGEQSEEDFMARYDFSFLTPRSQSMRCKVSFFR